MKSIVDAKLFIDNSYETHKFQDTLKDLKIQIILDSPSDSFKRKLVKQMYSIKSFVLSFFL